MKNSEHWFATKYEFKNKKLRASRNPKFLTVSSRLMTDITASFYQHYIPLHVKGKLADLGCGNVPFYPLYKDLVTENVCVDWPNTMHKNQYVDYECDLNKPLPFINNEFDTIIISEVLEHIANPDLIVSEMTRILKPNGKILLSVPFFYKIHEAPYDYYRYTEFALKYLTEKNGLTTLEIKSFGGLPEIFTDIIAKNITRLPVAGMALAEFIQWSCAFFLKTTLGKNLSVKTGKSFPLGYFMVVQKQ